MDRIIVAAVSLSGLLSLVAACTDRVGNVEYPIIGAPTASSVVAPVSSAPPEARVLPGDYASSTACKQCHTTIYDQWSQSMHANALRSPLMIAQTNLDARNKSVGQAQGMCVNCHGPVAATMTPSETLPLPGGPVANEGIGCVTCHSVADASKLVPGAGSGAMLAAIEPGRRYYGPIADPVESAFHAAQRAPGTYDEPEKLCAGCHDVGFDRDGDNQVRHGIDLVLQTTFDEYREYRDNAGDQTCTGCHMRPLANRGRVADGDLGTPNAPLREIHDHSFVGVDVPMDATTDPQQERRHELLGRAADMRLVAPPTLSGTKLSFKLVVQNRSGHALPTGFAFARQLWIEVKVSDQQSVVYSSGALFGPGDDLCDTTTFNDAFRRSMQGCFQADPDLVNLQSRLVDRTAIKIGADGQGERDQRGELLVVAPADAVETVSQFLKGGPVPRIRPSTKEVLSALRPAEIRVFNYDVDLARTLTPGQGKLSARLLFRSLAPYFLRELGRLQPPNEMNVGTYADKTEVIEMVKTNTTF